MTVPLRRRAVCWAVVGLIATRAAAQERTPDRPPPSVLFANVRVFDGKSDKLTEPTNVLVIGNKISKLGKKVGAARETTVIDSGGRVLMPGLIDAHWHAILCANTLAEVSNPDIAYLTLNAAAEAGRTLMRGVTSVRDMGGPT